jgi:RHS repeat-associated protein
MRLVTRQVFLSVWSPFLTVVLCVSLFYAPLLVALQPKFVAAAAPKRSLHPRNFSPPQQLATFALFWRKLAGLFQSGVSLDTLRGTTPQAPATYQPWTLPPATNDDPKPINTANYDTYLTSAVQPDNATGPVGALPLQAPDPTVSKSVTSGLSVDIIQRRFNFSVPVLGLAGRAGLGVGLALSYSNNLWQTSSAGTTFNVDRGFPAPGWRLGFGAILVRDPVNGVYYNSVTQQYSIIYLAPDGTRHDMRSAGSGVYETYDGSYLQFNANTQVLSFPNGTHLQFGEYSYETNNHDYLALPVKVTDRHGNFLQISYTTLNYPAHNGQPASEKKVIEYVTDTAGRRIDFEYSNNRLTGIKQNRPATGWFYYVRLDYAPVTLQTDFTAADPSLPLGSQVWMLARITYPTGASLRFTFNGYGQIAGIAKWAPTITGQGVEREVAATVFGYDTDYSPMRLKWRTEAAENWQGASYGYSLGATGPAVNDNGERRYEVNLNGLVYTFRTFAPNGDSALKWETTTYQQDTGLSYRSNPRVTATEIVDLSVSGSPKVRGSSTVYQQFHGMWLPVQQFDQPDGAGGSYRYTLTTYKHYPAQRLLGLPETVEIHKGSNNVLLSKVQNNYDESGGYTDSNNTQVNYLEAFTGAVQHDDTNYGLEFIARGNLTSVTQFNVGAEGGSRIVKRANYDTTGNLLGAADAAGIRKQIDYTDNYENKPANLGPTRVFPFTTTDPSGFKSGGWYDYYTGNTRKTFNIPTGSQWEQVVETEYDSLTDRPKKTKRPDEGIVETHYWDNLLVLGTKQQIDAGKTRFKWEFMDGAGQVFKKASDHPDGVSGKYTGQLFAYDGSGRVKDSSNVLAVNGGFTPVNDSNDPNDPLPSWLFTNITYDMFSRMIMAKRPYPDNNEIHVDYEGCGCAGSTGKRITDELGNYTETHTDLYGRLAAAVEPQGTENNIYSKALYTYDELDRLVQITHTASLNYYAQQTPTQTRTFSYDGYGRLLSETTPEAGTVSYTYTTNDLMASATNANGKTTMYSYNTRNLPTAVGYSDSTPGVGYQYDAYGARTQMTDGEGQTTYSYNNYRQLQSETRTFTSLPDNQYTLSYSYNQAEQVKTVNYYGTSGSGVPGAPFSQTDSKNGPASAYTISGTVTNAQNQPVAGVTITLNGSQSGSTTTNGSGQYSFSNLPQSGNYILTPALAGYVFNPVDRTYNNLQSDKTSANFTALVAMQTVLNKNVNYAYNTVGALSGVGTNLIGTDPNNTSNVINSLSFKAFGAIKQLNYGNGLQLTMGYNDTRQQPISMKVGPNGTGSILDYSYEYYDANGHNNNRIRSIVDGTDSAYSVNYSYDQYNRLTHATAAAYTRAYAYDPFGNLRTVTGTGGPNPNYTLNYEENSTTAPATNRILSVTENGSTQPFTYDNAGNLTLGDGMTYAYDAANRLTSVNNGVLGQYGYDGDGARVKKVEGGVSMHYVRSSKFGRVAFEVGQASLQRVYVYSGSGKLLLEQATDGQIYWLHTSHLNSTRAMTDSSGNLSYKGQFDPHGQMLLEWSATGNPNLNTLKFTGYERDVATGLDYAEARTYKGNRGRFVQPDPKGMGAAKQSQPQSLNPYSYVHNDPVNYVDPGGTDAIIWECVLLKKWFDGDSEIWWGLYSCRSYRELSARDPSGNSGGGGEQGGRGSGGSRSNIKPPKAKIKTPRETAPGCGKSEFDIEWEIEGAGRGGWLIQHVIKETNVLNADGSVKEKKTTEFWEAWRVGNDGKIQFSGIDTFRFGSYGAETRGSLSATGYAKYYEGYTLPDDFRLGGAGILAGDLRSTMDKPSGWTDENAYMHQLKVKL